VVVYAAFPPNLDDQLDETRYRVARAADDSAFAYVGQAIAETPNDTNIWEEVEKRVKDAMDRYPTAGEFLAESHGMRGSGTKRLAQTQFQLAEMGSDPENKLKQCIENLKAAARHYWLAAEVYMVPEGEKVQRLSSLHWVLTQWLCLEAVLGHRIRNDLWMTAKVSAEMERDKVGGLNRVWALGSLAELYLLQLTLPKNARVIKEGCTEEAVACAAEIVAVDREPGSWPVFSTRRGFSRYTDWWCSDLFVDYLKEHGVRRPVDWLAEGSVRDAAKQIMKTLVADHG
jgi:hypothetical protein